VDTRVDILAELRANPEGVSGHVLSTALERRDAAFTASRDGLVNDGLVLREPRKGRGGGQIYRLNTEHTEHTENIRPNIRPHVPFEPTEPPSKNGGSGSVSSRANIPNSPPTNFGGLGALS
jgi:DNA-binding transcriptional ArsR family regulator